MENYHLKYCVYTSKWYFIAAVFSWLFMLPSLIFAQNNSDVLLFKSRGEQWLSKGLSIRDTSIIKYIDSVELLFQEETWQILRDEHWKDTLRIKHQYLQSMYALYSGLPILSDSLLQNTIEESIRKGKTELSIDLLEDAALKYFYKSMYLPAESALKAAMELTHSSGDEVRNIEQTLNLGFVIFRKGDREKCLNWYYLGLQKAEKGGYPELVAKAHNFIGLAQQKQKLFDKSLHSYHRSLKIRSEIENRKDIAITLNNIGTLYDDWGNLDSALHYYYKSLEVRKTLENDGDIAQSLNNLGYLWKNEGEYNEAISYLKESLEYWQRANDLDGYLSGVTNLGNTYLLMGMVDSALLYIQEVEQITEQLPSIENQMNLYRMKSEWAELVGDYKSSLEFFKEYYNFNRQLINEDIRFRASEADWNYQFLTKEIENREKITREKNLRNAMILISALLLIISLLLFQKFQLKKRTAAEMVLKNKIIQTEKEKAEAGEKFKSHFVASMSHEIRTPLNAIIGMSGLMEDDKLNEKQIFYLHGIQDSAKHLLGIINDALDLSKIERLQPENTKALFNPIDVGDSVHSMFSFQARDKKIGFSKYYQDDLPEKLLGDPNRIRQILVNLVRNAIKFTQHGEVTLSISGEFTNDRYLLICSVQDTGVGIDQNNLPDLFKPFMQFETEMSQGTGLGLYICKQLAEYMGGEIQVASKKGEGTTFTFSVLLDPVIDTKSADELSPGKLGELLSGIRILIGEDNLYNQVVAEGLFKRFIPDVIIQIVSDGDAVLDELLSDDFDILLLDLKMPGKNGYEVLKQIRVFSNPSHGIPVIMWSATTTEKDIEKAITEGANDFAPKPIDIEKLLTKMCTLLRSDVKIKPLNLYNSIPLIVQYSEGDPDIINSEINSLLKELRRSTEIFQTKNKESLQNYLHNLGPRLEYCGLVAEASTCRNLEERIRTHKLPKYFEWQNWFSEIISKVQALTILSQ